MNNYQYILGRDIVDMAIKYADDADIIEYCDSFAFALARIFEDKAVVDWDAISSICDSRWYSMRANNPEPLAIEHLKDIGTACQEKIDEQQSSLNDSGGSSN